MASLELIGDVVVNGAGEMILELAVEQTLLPWAERDGDLDGGPASLTWAWALRLELNSAVWSVTIKLAMSFTSPRSCSSR